MALRRTKIIATLGPATDDEEMLTRMFQAGVDLVRLNFSHGTQADHAQRIEWVRSIGRNIDREIGIIADLQGPKLRIARFKNQQVNLSPGASFILNADLDSNAGDETQVGLDYKNLPQDVVPGDTLLLDDGRIVLQVKTIEGNAIHCVVKVGGSLSNNKGLNRLGGGLTAKALTEKDLQDLKFAVQADVDYVAISFPRSAEDIIEARRLIKEVDHDTGIIAKIERTEAILAIDEIIAASDAVMVARGDLGVEIGDAELPGVQKDIIHRARNANKAVITATQMMESMIYNAIPTRAEVFDVANAVLDGTDAVMLSAETATGKHPDQVVAAMARICLGAEKQPRAKMSRHRAEAMFKRADEAIAMAAMYTANHLDISGIVALTESGSTPIWMSRIRSGIPIFGLCRFPWVRRRMTLYRGVYPIAFDVLKYDLTEVNRKAINTLEERGLLKQNDLAIITRGDIVGVHGGSNMLKIVQVGHVV